MQLLTFGHLLIEFLVCLLLSSQTLRINIVKTISSLSLFLRSVLQVSKSGWQSQDHRRPQSRDRHTAIVSSPLEFMLRLLERSVFNVAFLGFLFSHLLSNKPTRKRNCSSKVFVDLIVPGTPQQTGSVTHIPLGCSWRQKQTTKIWLWCVHLPGFFLLIL